jgi:glycosyltransferase involved in cell wall biosynthesis
MCSIIEVKRVGVAPMVTDMLVKKVGIPRNKTVTINNAIDLSSFDYNQNCSDLRKTFGIPDSHKIVGVVGRLEPQKGHIFFIQAAHEILSQCSNISFLIVGDGILKQKLVGMTKEFNQERKIYFTGIRKDIPQLLSIIDIYVMPSLWEGLPLALLEAMAMKKPIVATRVGGIQDVVEDGKDALLVPPGDSNALAEKVIFLLKRPELCLTLGTNAREKVEKKYNAELMVKEYEETYGDILFR